MLITDLRSTTADGWTRLVTHITWEENPSRDAEMFVDVPPDIAGHATLTPDAFITALLPLAMWMGERRIRVEGSLSPRLDEGLRAAAALFSAWYPRCGSITIESTDGRAPRTPSDPSRAAGFLSGGVDALAALRANHLDYPASHPERIRDGIVVFGLNSYDAIERERPARLAAFERHVGRLAAFGAKIGITILPLRTNIRALYPDYHAWAMVGVAASMSGIAMCLSRRIDRVTLGSSGVGLVQPPRGSHPYLDHHFSSEALTLYPAQLSVTRFEKTRLVSEWPEGLSILRTCLYHTVPAHDRVNCGECEKCLRTMVCLLALGKLNEAPTFAASDVSPSALSAIVVENDFQREFYAQCMNALHRRGRRDLVQRIRTMIADYDQRQRRERVRGLVRRLLRR